jgi:hypothetical protein
MKEDSEELRHHDHKFEFTREQFTEFCRQIERDYPDYKWDESRSKGLRYLKKDRIKPEFWDTKAKDDFVTLVAVFVR